jgi:hypothetical protein
VFVYYMVGGGGLSVAIYALPLLFFAGLLRVDEDDEAAEATVGGDPATARSEPSLS